jgi:hypothetical protein
MRLVLMLFAFSLMVAAQEATAVYAPLGIPCDPAGPSPLGEGFPFICPPEEEQGILVFLRTDSGDAVGYRTTVRYTTAAGEEKEAVQVVAKREVGIWTADVFRIGRLRTASLSGIKVDSVRAEPLTSLESPQVPTNISRNTKEKTRKTAE